MAGVAPCWRCDFCKGYLEFVNGYARCTDCHISEKSDSELRKQFDSRKRLMEAWLQSQNI